MRRKRFTWLKWLPYWWHWMRYGSNANEHDKFMAEAIMHLDKMKSSGQKPVQYMHEVMRND